MQFTENKKVLILLVFIAGVSLSVGLFAPIITFKKFIFIQNTFSILTACWNLLQQGQLFLFTVIFLFSVMLPIFKLGMLSIYLIHPPKFDTSIKSILTCLHRLGRWSMLDVFVVAILVVVVKLGAIGSVEKHIGLYAYAIAALLTMYLSHIILAAHAIQKS